MFYRLTYTPSFPIDNLDKKIETKGHSVIEHMENIHVICTQKSSQDIKFLVAITSGFSETDKMYHLRHRLQHTLGIKDKTVPFSDLVLIPISIEEAVAQLDGVKACYEDTDVLVSLLKQFKFMKFETARQNSMFLNKESLLLTDEFKVIPQVAKSPKLLWINYHSSEILDEYLSKLIQHINALIPIESSAYFVERINYFTELRHLNIFFEESFMNTIRGYGLFVMLDFSYPGSASDNVIRGTIIPQLVELSHIAKVVLITHNDDSLTKQLSGSDIDYLPLNLNYADFKTK